MLTLYYAIWFLAVLIMCGPRFYAMFDYWYHDRGSQEDFPAYIRRWNDLFNRCVVIALLIMFANFAGWIAYISAHHQP